MWSQAPRVARSFLDMTSESCEPRYRINLVPRSVAPRIKQEPGHHGKVHVARPFRALRARLGKRRPEAPLETAVENYARGHLGRAKA